MKFTIITGLTGCGKTTYAKFLQNKYVSFDDLFDYSSVKLNYTNLKNQIDNDEDVVMDGIMFQVDTDLSMITQCVQPRQVEIVLLYTTLDHLYDCQRSTPVRKQRVETDTAGLTKEQEFGINRSVFINVYNHAMKSGAPVKFLYRIENNYEEQDENHFLRTMGMTKDELFKYIQQQYSGKQAYQTVEYKGEVIHHGTEKCWLSWENIQKLGIDWQNKKVLDIGSYFGYFSTKVLQQKAQSVVALDQNSGLLEVFSNVMIANGFTNYSTIVRKLNQESTDIPNGFDVTLVLNCLHHIKEASGSNYPILLKNILNSASDIVFEVNSSELADIKRETTEDKVDVIDSHRPNRKIVHVKR